VAVREHGGAATDTVPLGALGLVAFVQANTSLLMGQWTSLRVWERPTGLTSVRTGLEGSSSSSAGLRPCHFTTVALLRPLCHAVLGLCTLVGAIGPPMATMMICSNTFSLEVKAGLGKLRGRRIDGGMADACMNCLPGWRAQGWWCFGCQTDLSDHDLRLGRRGLLVVEAGQSHCAWHVAWPYIPFVTVGQLLCHLAREVIGPVLPWQVLSIEVDDCSYCLTPPTLAMDDVVLWKLRPLASPLLVRARVTQVGGGIPRRLALRQWAVAPRETAPRDLSLGGDTGSQDDQFTAFSCSAGDSDSEPEQTGRRLWQYQEG